MLYDVLLKIAITAVVFVLYALLAFIIFGIAAFWTVNKKSKSNLTEGEAQ